MGCSTSKPKPSRVSKLTDLEFTPQSPARKIPPASSPPARKVAPASSPTARKVPPPAKKFPSPGKKVPPPAKKAPPPAVTPPTAASANAASSSLTAEDIADVARWRGFVAQGLPIPVLLMLMKKEGLKESLMPLIFANQEKTQSSLPTRKRPNATPPTSFSDFVEDMAYVARWREFVAQGLPTHVLLMLMKEEGVQENLMPLIFANQEKAQRNAPNVPQIVLSDEELRTVSLCKQMLTMDDGVVSPNVVASFMREIEPVDPKLIPLVFGGFQPEECDAYMNRAECEAVIRYRGLLCNSFNPIDLARLMDREKADSHIFMLVFSDVPTPRLPPTPHPARGEPDRRPRKQTKFNELGLVTSITYVGMRPPEIITGPVVKDGITFGRREARTEECPNWSVRQGVDNEFYLCERRYSNYPNIVIRGTNQAYDEIERRVKAGPNAEGNRNSIYLGDKLARDMSNPNAQDWKVRPGWDTPYHACERCYSEFPNLVVASGTNQAYTFLEQRIRGNAGPNAEGDQNNIYLGDKLARDLTNPTAQEWSVRPGWDTPFYLCERRYSNYPNIVIHGTNQAYDEIERRVKAGPNAEGNRNNIYLGDKLARDLSNPNAQDWKVRPGWDSSFVCERCYSEFPNLVARGSNQVYSTLEQRIRGGSEGCGTAEGSVRGASGYVGGGGNLLPAQ